MCRPRAFVSAGLTYPVPRTTQDAPLTRRSARRSFLPGHNAELVFDALTLPNPKVRYHIAPDTMRHLLAAVLPKRTMDRIIAKRLGLLPPAT